MITISLSLKFKAPLHLQIFFQFRNPTFYSSPLIQTRTHNRRREREREREGKSSQAFEEQGHRFIQGFTRTHFEFLSLFLVFICLTGNIGGFSFSCCKTHSWSHRFPLVYLRFDILLFLFWEHYR